MRRPALKSLTATFALAPAVVLAHSGHADSGGFLQGLSHPVTGVDHVLAMIAVGVLAARLGGSARWLVPLAFIGVMVVGDAFGMAGIPLPFAEVGVALSVVVLGMAIAFPVKLRALAVAMVASLFALFHGYVHGTETPLATSAIAYTAGFVVATAFLHLIGITLGTMCGLPQMTPRQRVLRAGGGAMTLFGIAVLTGSL